jgi:hypothetical protein
VYFEVRGSENGEGFVEGCDLKMCNLIGTNVSEKFAVSFLSAVLKCW